MSFSEVKPRHVLCLLGGERPFSDLCEMIQSAIDDFALGFEIDYTFSEDAPDDRMPISFEVCRDRVKKGAWTEVDEEAVSDHRSVIYVLGPPMTAEDAVKHSAIALRLVAHTLDNGIVAAKGESAGVAHGVERWKELARDAEGQTGAALAHPCRLAFAKRPIGTDEHLYSIGFHLVGIPEVYAPRSLSDDELALSALIDTVADEVFSDGVETVLKHRGAQLLPVDAYDEDEFKYNPFGAIHLAS
ncbi:MULTISPECIES: hypothetical protein [unclassified Ensifer]|uniref:hypothetical protein n=1 Tax=unclassified Ensifer TaxID=2633371 RepID=UPI00087E132B|nr:MULTISPECIES: hypothetical protein [unclassified Ensifer]MBD9591723.1 hypothetical protein [Ensifer sp. ENS05]SDL26768.1 hypothetical protein SAMN05216328_101532 [Ensifer sp. YR511]